MSTIPACPFCGVRDFDLDGMNPYRVSCLGCEAHGPWGEEMDDDDEEAQEDAWRAWSQRAQLPPPTPEERLARYRADLKWLVEAAAEPSPDAALERLLSDWPETMRRLARSDDMSTGTPSRSAKAGSMRQRLDETQDMSNTRVLTARVTAVCLEPPEVTLAIGEAEPRCFNAPPLLAWMAARMPSPILATVLEGPQRRLLWVRAATEAELQEQVDAWHEAETELGLPEWLGMSDEEYARWVETGERRTSGQAGDGEPR